jgi:hypothetical protein
VLLRQTDGLLTVTGLTDDVEPGVSQHFDDIEPDEHLVLGDHDAASAGSGGDSFAIGHGLSLVSPQSACRRRGALSIKSCTPPPERGFP